MHSLARVFRVLMVCWIVPPAQAELHTGPIPFPPYVPERPIFIDPICLQMFSDKTCYKNEDGDIVAFPETPKFDLEPYNYDPIHDMCAWAICTEEFLQSRRLHNSGEIALNIGVLAPEFCHSALKSFEGLYPPGGDFDVACTSFSAMSQFHAFWSNVCSMIPGACTGPEFFYIFVKPREAAARDYCASMVNGPGCDCPADASGTRFCKPAHAASDKETDGTLEPVEANPSCNEREVRDPCSSEEKEAEQADAQDALNDIEDEEEKVNQTIEENEQKIEENEAAIETAQVDAALGNSEAAAFVDGLMRETALLYQENIELRFRMKVLAVRHHYLTETVLGESRAGAAEAARIERDTQTEFMNLSWDFMSDKAGDEDLGLALYSARQARRMISMICIATAGTIGLTPRFCP